MARPLITVEDGPPNDLLTRQTLFLDELIEGSLELLVGRVNGITKPGPRTLGVRRSGGSPHHPNVGPDAESLELVAACGVPPLDLAPRWSVLADLHLESLEHLAHPGPTKGHTVYRHAVDGAIRERHEKVLATSPVGHTIQRNVPVSVELT